MAKVKKKVVKVTEGKQASLADCNAQALKSRIAEEEKQRELNAAIEKVKKDMA